MQAFTDVAGTYNELKRMTFEDETGDYGYKGKYRGRACWGQPTPEEVVICAKEKHDFKGPTESDEENRIKFAIMDIKEACSKNKMCYDRDPDGVPVDPNPICMEHNACPVPGVSLREIPKDIKDFYKDLKNIFYSLGDTKDKKARIDNRTHNKIRDELLKEMREMVKEYNEMPYPGKAGASSFSDSFPGSDSNSANSSNSDSLSCDDKLFKEFKKEVKVPGNGFNKAAKSKYKKYRDLGNNVPAGEGENNAAAGEGENNAAAGEGNNAEGNNVPAGEGENNAAGPKNNAQKGGNNGANKKNNKAGSNSTGSNSGNGGSNSTGSNSGNGAGSNSTGSNSGNGGSNNGEGDAGSNSGNGGSNNGEGEGEAGSNNGEGEGEGEAGSNNGEGEGEGEGKGEGEGEGEEGEKEKSAFEEELSEQDNNISESDEGVILTSKQKLEKMEKWFEVWNSQEKTAKRKSTGCENFAFFEDMSDTDILNQPVSEENIKKYYIQSFLRAVDGFEIFNEEVDEQLEEELKKIKSSKTAVDDEIEENRKEEKEEKKKTKKKKKGANNNNNSSNNSGAGSNNTGAGANRASNNAGAGAGANRASNNAGAASNKTGAGANNAGGNQSGGVFNAVTSTQRAIVKAEKAVGKQASKAGKAAKTVGKYTGLSYVGKKLGITEAMGLREIPGVDLNCDYLNLTMADVNECFFADSEKCDETYAHKMGVKKNTKYLPSFKFVGNVTGLSNITLNGLYDSAFITRLTNEELENRLNKLLKRLPQGNCICKNYVPTGIFQIDWKYFRLCFLNFKQIISMAREKGKSPDFIETRLRELFLDEFFDNFSGDFVEYRDILLKFGEKYRKLCKLKLRFLLPADKILYARTTALRNVIKGYDEPLKELAALIKEKQLDDRESYRKYKKKNLRKT